MTEREFQKIVLDLFFRYGWKTAHFDASVRVVGKERRFVGDKGSAGFPDIVAARDTRVIFAELKSENGRVSGNQREWLDLLRLAGMEVYLWYPSDLVSIAKTISCKELSKALDS